MNIPIVGDEYHGVVSATAINECHAGKKTPRPNGRVICKKSFTFLKFVKLVIIIIIIIVQLLSIGFL